MEEPTNAKARELIESIVRDAGYDLYDLERKGAAVVVSVDRVRSAQSDSDGAAERERQGIDLAELAKLTRAISRMLDEADPIPGSYTLEVSSPGLERNLRKPAHFEAVVGEPVSIKLLPTSEGRRRVRGTVRAVDASGIDLLVDDPAGETMRVEYGEIDKARTVFEWGVRRDESTKVSSR